MLWLLTPLGAALGAWLAGIPGALLGALLGHVFDRQLQLDWKSLFERLFRRKPPLQGEELLFVLFGRLAKSGGRVTEAHIQAARAEMERRYFDPIRQRAAIRAFGRGKAGSDNLQPALEALRWQPDEAKALLQSCWRLARAQGEPHNLACRLIEQWGAWAGWSVEAVAQQDTGRKNQSQSHVRDDYQAALHLLGVRSNTDAREIKLAYRRLLSQCHPDKLAGTGASPAALKEATERTRQLHSAYELIRQRLGF